MTADLKPYPEYKDSGPGWLSGTPDGWSVLPGRTLFEEKLTKNHPDERLLSVTISAGVLPQEEHLAGTSSKDSSNLDKTAYKLVEPGDIAYNKMRAWQGAAGVSRYRGIVSPAYIVMRSRGAVSPDFVHRLIRIPAFAKEAERWSYGITSDQWSFRSKDFKQVYFPVPPLDEQAAIVSYLDHIDSRIRRFIEAQEQLIELLREEKQAVIHRAVTHGLNPEVPVNPSGIDWLGDIPAHWKVGQLRRFAQVIDCKHLTVPFADEGLPCVSVRQVGSFEVDLSTAPRITPRDYEGLRGGGRTPALGDLVYCRNVNVGACALVSSETGFALGQDVCLIKPRTHEGDFLNLVMHSAGMKQHLARELIGSTFNRINIAEVKSLRVPCPPIEEQRRIAALLQRRMTEFDQRGSAARRQRDLLREYRTRLISDLVTGKLDVLKVARELPDDLDADAPALDEQLEEAIS